MLDVFEPLMPPARVREMRGRWTEALERAKAWKTR